MDPTLATIIVFAGNFAPRNWAFCDGRLLAVQGNEALFSLLGTTYGGDGRTSFRLPDLRKKLMTNPSNMVGEVSMNFIICTSGVFPSRD